MNEENLKILGKWMNAAVGILAGILLCLMIIAFKLDDEEYVHLPAPNVNVSDKGGRVVQIAPNRIGVMDYGNTTGKEQLVVFEYDPANRTFKPVSTLDYEYFLKNAEEYGIPIREN